MYNHSSFSTSPLSSLNSDDIKALSTISIMPMSTADIAAALNGSTYPRSGIAPLTTSQVVPPSVPRFSLNIAAFSMPPSTFHTTSDAKFDGDIVWKGRSLGKILETIESRLAILEPKPSKLEKFKSLKNAYDHYKLLETLINDEDEE
jgi:hypothetical protein